MFLNDEEIRNRLAKGDLRIDPQPEADQLGSFTVDLRLGAQFAQFSAVGREAVVDITLRSTTQGSFQKQDLITVPIGDNLVLAPGGTLLAVTMEYVHLPLDLAGFLFPRAAWERVGLSVALNTIDSGFRGKLTLSLHNNNTAPIALYPGLSIVRLCLAQLNAAARQRVPSTIFKGWEPLPSDAERPPSHSDRPAVPVPALTKKLSEVLGAKGAGRGKALEEFMAELFSGLKGLRILKRNARLSAEELDLVVKNDIDTGFWRIAGSPIIVECKNWSDRVGAREISVLVDKLRSVSPDCRTGVLVAVNGITGDAHADAYLKVREARRDGRYVIVLERSDLEDVANGTSLGAVIERKYETILLI